MNEADYVDAIEALRANLRRVAMAWWRASLCHGPCCPCDRPGRGACECGFAELSDVFDSLPADLQPEAFGL